MVQVQATIEVDDEYADASDRTGLSEEGFNTLHDAVQESVGTMTDVKKV